MKKAVLIAVAAGAGAFVVALAILEYVLNAIDEAEARYGSGE